MERKGGVFYIGSVVCFVNVGIVVQFVVGVFSIRSVVCFVTYIFETYIFETQCAMVKS